MKFRHARHCHSLPEMIRFYRDGLGLLVLGTFEGHDGYDGVFLGPEAGDWHLEFTVSDAPAQHCPDPDDLLVFYVNSRPEMEQWAARIEKTGGKPVEPANPYWKKQGVTFEDPEGYRVVVALEPNSEKCDVRSSK
jgi:catechol 2,3-dioxygenase-like lactoylglutathione lyase family enzyme